jgi:hypothetical protein
LARCAVVASLPVCRIIRVARSPGKAGIVFPECFAAEHATTPEKQKRSAAFDAERRCGGDVGKR